MPQPVPVTDVSPVLSGVFEAIDRKSRHLSAGPNSIVPELALLHLVQAAVELRNSSAVGERLSREFPIFRRAGELTSFQNGLLNVLRTSAVVRELDAKFPGAGQAVSDVIEKCGAFATLFFAMTTTEAVDFGINRRTVPVHRTEHRPDLLRRFVPTNPPEVHRFVHATLSGVAPALGDFEQSHGSAADAAGDSVSLSRRNTGYFSRLLIAVKAAGVAADSPLVEMTVTAGASLVIARQLMQNAISLVRFAANQASVVAARLDKGATIVSCEEAGTFLRLHNLCTLATNAVSAHAAEIFAVDATAAPIFLATMFFHGSALGGFSVPAKEAIGRAIRLKSITAFIGANPEPFIDNWLGAHVSFPHLMDLAHTRPLLRDLPQFKASSAVVAYRLGFMSAGTLHAALGDTQWRADFERERAEFNSGVDAICKRVTAADEVPAWKRDVVASLLRIRGVLAEWDCALPPKAPQKPVAPKGETAALPAPVLTDDGKECLRHRGKVFSCPVGTKVKGTTFFVLGAYRQPREVAYRIAIDVDGTWQLINATELLKVIARSTTPGPTIPDDNLRAHSPSGILSGTRANDFIEDRLGRTYRINPTTTVRLLSFAKGGKTSKQVFFRRDEDGGNWKNVSRPAILLHAYIRLGLWTPIGDDSYGAVVKKVTAPESVMPKGASPPPTGNPPEDSAVS